NRHLDKLLPAVARVYRNFSQQFPTATLNKNLEKIVRAVSPPSVGGKDFKIRYVTQTGAAPPILTLFTNSRFPPPDSYHRYLKNRMRECYDLEGSPLVLKYRKE
ncbi:MAG: ribosome biogenesis GTPase Der, partial [Acidobacteriota bacterium]